MAEEKFHSGFVALVGRPNVGKSTLMNAVLGEKVSIVSAHAQTTRNKITGVWNGKNSQVVFLDTPGMHKPQSKLGQVIRQSTVDALDEVDVIVFICACNDPLGAGDRYILSLRPRHWRLWQQYHGGSGAALVRHGHLLSAAAEPLCRRHPPAGALPL